MIAIVDYGMGNIHSVKKALELYGAKTIVTNNPKDVRSCEKIVLPGVGAFDDAMSGLKKQDLIGALKDELKQKKPFLGICLGMQLLFEESQEAPGVRGLGILKGRVKKFAAKGNLKIPHIGWNQLKNIKIECPLLKDIPQGAYVYFCHSYYPQPQDKGVIAAVCNYGVDFSALVWQDNLYGVQFHPEKSQAAGLKMLQNFVQRC